MGVGLGFAWIFLSSTTAELFEHLILIPLAIASVLAHELAHAFSARLAGAQVRHIALTAYGGYVDFWLPPRTHWWEAAIAFAGPVANFAIAAAAWAALAALAPTWDAFAVSWRDPLHWRVLAGFMWFNVALGAFNLLPGLPLDGGYILRAILNSFTSPGRAHWAASWSGVAAGIGVLTFAAWSDNVLGIAAGAGLAVVAWNEKRSVPYS